MILSTVSLIVNLLKYFQCDQQTRGHDRARRKHAPFTSAALSANKKACKAGTGIAHLPRQHTRRDGQVESAI